MRGLEAFEGGAGPAARAARSVRRALAQGRLGHAYIVSGHDEADRRAFARALAAARLCPTAEGASADGCGRCRSCRLVAQDAHPDLAWLGPEPGKRIIAIDGVRALLSDLQLTPVEGSARAAVIEPADAMREEGQNALLKTLEEPPPGVLVALVTGRPELLLPTVRSRAMELRLGRGAPAAGEREQRAAAAKRLLERAAPLERAKEAYAAVDRIASALEGGTPTERRRLATLAVLDAAVEAVGRHARERALAGRDVTALERMARRLDDAALHIDANVSPLATLEVLCFDLDAIAARRFDEVLVTPRTLL